LNFQVKNKNSLKLKGRCEIMTANQEKFKKIEIVAPTAGLTPGYLKALDSLKKVVPIFNKIFLNQVYEQNEELLKGIEAKKECNGVIEEFFLLNYGPWNRIDRNISFLPDVKIKKPLGANFYPLDMTTDEFEKYLLTLSPQDQLKAKGPQYVIKSFSFFFLTFFKRKRRNQTITLFTLFKRIQ
jgi:hypothetical protein